MTEKRFTLKYIEEQHLSANLYDNGTFISSIRIGAELIVELLNSLNDENVKLRARNKYLATKIERERASAIKQHKKWENEAITENEKIKQQRDFYYARLQKIIRIANGDLE
jgi:hypothetical protein